MQNNTGGLDSATGRGTGRGPDGGRHGGGADIVVAAAAGVAGWTALEYAIHRVLGHVPRGRGIASREHLSHHADVTYFTPARLKALSAGSTAAIAFPATAALFGRRRAAGFTVGLVTMYFAYEVVHRRVHTHPPRGAYSHWIRRNHLHHHAGNPMANFGVTSPLWDRAFGTGVEPPPVLRLGRRIAPDWLMDDDGNVREPYRATYEVVGMRRVDVGDDGRAADRDAAFANEAPPPEQPTPSTPVRAV